MLLDRAERPRGCARVGWAGAADGAGGGCAAVGWRAALARRPADGATFDWIRDWRKGMRDWRLGVQLPAPVATGAGLGVRALSRAAQSPKQIPRSRAVSIVSQSNG